LNGCATTSGCRSTTPCGGASRRTSRLPCSASRSTPTSTHRRGPTRCRRWTSRTSSVTAGSRAGLLALALGFVLVVGTANAGGYRFGVSDQAFYIPAIEMAAGTATFPRDTAVFAPQMRFWIGDEVLGTVAALTGVPLDRLFAILYLISTVGLGLAVVALARSLGCGPWTIALALVLLTLRHRIART